MCKSEVYLEILRNLSRTSWEQRLRNVAAQLEFLDILPEEEADFYNKFVNEKLLVCCDEELTPLFFEKYAALRKLGVSYKEAMYTLGFFAGKAKAIAEGRCIRSWKIYKKLVEVELETFTEMKIEALQTLHKAIVNMNVKAAMFYLERRFPEAFYPNAQHSSEGEQKVDLDMMRRSRLEELRRCQKH